MKKPSEYRYLEAFYSDYGGLGSTEYHSLTRMQYSYQKIENQSLSLSVPPPRR